MRCTTVKIPSLNSMRTYLASIGESKRKPPGKPGGRIPHCYYPPVAGGLENEIAQVLLVLALLMFE